MARPGDSPVLGILPGSVAHSKSGAILFRDERPLLGRCCAAFRVLEGCRFSEWTSKDLEVYGPCGRTVAARVRTRRLSHGGEIARVRGSSPGERRAGSVGLVRKARS